MRRFSEFLERKDRDNKDHLHVLKNLLEKAGFDVKNHLNNHDDPYIYVRKPSDAEPVVDTLSFGGIRIYTRGKDIISFRPQNREEAEPFGTAYLLDVKGMYKDLMKDHQEEKVGRKLSKYIIEEVLNFFVHSAKAEKDDNEDVPADSLGKVITGGSGTGTDYSSTIGNDMSYKR